MTDQAKVARIARYIFEGHERRRRFARLRGELAPASLDEAYEVQDEVHRLFEWMGRKSRRKFPLKFTTRTARSTDNEFFFVSLDDFVPAIVMDPHNFNGKKMRPGQIDGRLNGIANSVTVTISGAKQADVWLGPGMVEFNRPITVHVNRDEVSGKSIRPDLGVLLEDFRVRSDRQKLFYAKVSFPRL